MYVSYKVEIAMQEFLRPMVAQDVKPGQEFYLLGDYNIVYKGKIDSVLNPSDMHKAFIADDGCRYGLENSFVLIKESRVKKQSKRTIKIVGTDIVLDLSRITSVSTAYEMIHLDKLGDYTWRLTYNDNLIPDLSKVESLQIVRENDDN